MKKLYKLVDGVLQYHEAWASGGTITEHWGQVGERGETREHKKPRLKSEESALLAVLNVPLSSGYAQLDEDAVSIVLVEYLVEGMGTPEDLDKRHALEDRMNETLGWTGLGNCDGGSIGSGSMEVCCMVVDVDVAARVIAEDLKDTAFANYSRIYEE